MKPYEDQAHVARGAHSHKSTTQPWQSAPCSECDSRSESKTGSACPAGSTSVQIAKALAPIQCLHFCGCIHYSSCPASAPVFSATIMPPPAVVMQPAVRKDRQTHGQVGQEEKQLEPLCLPTRSWQCHTSKCMPVPARVASFSVGSALGL